MRVGEWPHHVRLTHGHDALLGRVIGAHLPVNYDDGSPVQNLKDLVDLMHFLGDVLVGHQVAMGDLTFSRVEHSVVVGEFGQCE